MRFLAALLVALGLLAAPAHGGGLTTLGAGLGNDDPANVYSGSYADLNFKTGLYWWDGAVVSDPSTILTCVRASAGWAPDINGVYSSFANNVLRITNAGLLVEEARTNVVLSSRDLTAVSWTHTNVTAAKDQVGVDGASNSASSLTATANAGTSLAATTVASSARFQSAFVKRLIGSGTVEMTMDNGSTWTAVTVTADWSRVSVPTQTLANPTVGFRLGTSGDAIAVDFVQNENGTFVTSPIETTGAAVSRAVDVVSVTSTPPLGANFSVRATAIYPNSSANRTMFAGGPTNLLAYNSGSNTSGATYNGTNALFISAGTGGWSTGGTIAMAGATSSRALSLNDAATATDAFTQTWPATLYIGGNGSASPGSITITRATFWPVTLNSGDVRGVTR